MTPKLSKISTIFSSLSFKLFLMLFCTIILAFTVHGFIFSRQQSRIMENQVKLSATRTSDIIKRSLYTNMLLNERERTHENIRIIGQEPGVEVIRIYNKKGEITYSSNESEIGTSVDLQAEACYACHAADQPLERLSMQEKARIYTKNKDYRVLGLINPVENQPECSSSDCHAHPANQTILGVLDVQMTMQNLDQSVAASRNEAVSLALLIGGLSIFVIAGVLFFSIYRPTRKLREGTEKVAAGNLDFKIELDRNDELGVLARSFNHMSKNLKQADEELRAWSKTLEKRVDEKTEELEEMHHGMVQVEKMASLGRLSATVAHELNNPLSGIVTYARVLMRKINRLLPDNPEQDEILEELDLIRSESQRCGNIVKDLLIFARESSADFQKTQLHQVIERAIKLMQHHLDLGNIQMERQFNLKDDLVTCDQDKLVQALVAIMMNAVEAMPEGGKLTIRTQSLDNKESDIVRIRITDTGVGMSREVIDRIFDPFYSTKNATKGVGLGLAVVYGIIQRHNGHIHVDSAVGKGTTFNLDIPKEIQHIEKLEADNPELPKGTIHER